MRELPLFKVNLRDIAAITFLFALALSACAPAVTPDQATSKLKVIATFSFLGDFVHNVAGDNVELITLVGPDGDTHEYEPIPSDSKALAEADVIFEDGLGFEGWLTPLYTAASSKATRVVVSEGVNIRDIQEGDHKEIDPHIWHNVDNAMIMVRHIEAGLSKADAANAAFYKANADAYLAKLDALGKDVEAAVAQLPKDRRKLVTSHDALGYYADRYGFEIVGSVFGSVSTEAGEPSAQDFAAIVEAIKATGTQAIFLESVTNPSLIERVAKEAGVVVGPQLFTDALGKPGSEGSTYIDAVRYNTNAIVSALEDH